jgi:hypothetical protein
VFDDRETTGIERRSGMSVIGMSRGFASLFAELAAVPMRGSVG